MMESSPERPPHMLNQMHSIDSTGRKRLRALVPRSLTRSSLNMENIRPMLGSSRKRSFDEGVSSVPLPHSQQLTVFGGSTEAQGAKRQCQRISEAEESCLGAGTKRRHALTSLPSNPSTATKRAFHGDPDLDTPVFTKRHVKLLNSELERLKADVVSKVDRGEFQKLQSNYEHVRQHVLRLLQENKVLRDSIQARESREKQVQDELSNLREALIAQTAALKREQVQNYALKLQLQRGSAKIQNCASWGM